MPLHDFRFIKDEITVGQFLINNINCIFASFICVLDPLLVKISRFTVGPTYFAQVHSKMYRQRLAENCFGQTRSSCTFSIEFLFKHTCTHHVSLGTYFEYFLYHMSGHHQKIPSQWTGFLLVQGKDSI